MKEFRTTLVPGGKAPYRTWTFLVVPDEVGAELGPGPIAVRGTISGTAFRGTASRGEGVLRISLPHELRERAGIAAGDTVEVKLEVDPEPRSPEIPLELLAVFEKDPEAARLYERLPPSHRRAWAEYVGGAKRPDTRVRRAGKASAGIRAREFPR